MPTPPTFQAEYEVSSWDTNTNPKTVTPTTLAGDTLVVGAMSEDESSTISTPTGNSLTYTQQQSVVFAAFSECVVWTAPDATGGTGWTLSVSRSAGTNRWGFNTFRFSGSDGIGASAQDHVDSAGGATLNLTTSFDNSAIAVFVADWNATDGATRTWRTVNGITPSFGGGDELTYSRSIGFYTVYAAYYSDAGTAGVKTVGLSAPTPMKFSIVAVEIRGTTAGGVGNPGARRRSGFHPGFGPGRLMLSRRGQGSPQPAAPVETVAPARVVVKSDAALRIPRRSTGIVTALWPWTSVPDEPAVPQVPRPVMAVQSVAVLRPQRRAAGRVIAFKIPFAQPPVEAAPARPVAVVRDATFLRRERRAPGHVTTFRLPAQLDVQVLPARPVVTVTAVAVQQQRDRTPGRVTTWRIPAAPEAPAAPPARPVQNVTTAAVQQQPRRAAGRVTRTAVPAQATEVQPMPRRVVTVRDVAVQQHRRRSPGRIVRTTVRAAAPVATTTPRPVMTVLGGVVLRQPRTRYAGTVTMLWPWTSAPIEPDIPPPPITYGRASIGSAITAAGLASASRTTAASPGIGTTTTGTAGAGTAPRGTASSSDTTSGRVGGEG